LRWIIRNDYSTDFLPNKIKALFMKPIITTSILVLFFSNLMAQVKIGGAPGVPPVSSAVLELDGGNNRGLLLPRMRKMDIDAIQNPAEGLTIYATDLQAIFLRRSGNWVKMNGSGDAFSLPYSGVFSESIEPVLSITNNINGGIGIYGASGIGAGTGVYGYAFNGNGYGIKGTAIFGRGGYFSSRNSHALITDSGRVGFGTLSPTAFMEIDATKSDASNTVIINDDDDPVMQFRKAGVNRSMIKQEGNHLVLRPNGQNTTGKVMLRSYNDNGALIVDSIGNVTVGVAPLQHWGSLYNSRMNISSDVDQPTLTLHSLQSLSMPYNGPSLKFTAGNPPFNELGSINSDGWGLNINAHSKIHFQNGSGWFTWGVTGVNNPIMFLNEGNGKGRLKIDGIVTVGNNTNSVSSGSALNIFPDAEKNGEAIMINANDPLIRMKNNGVDKGFIQLADNDIKIGSVASNERGRYIVRTGGLDRLWVDSVGYVTIGGRIGPILNGPYRLAVRGKIAATDFNVVATGSWPDYVFADDYKLRSLEETEAYIKEHKHLPNIPAAAVVEKEGFALGDMQKRMMEKIEELTLHLIEANKSIQSQQKQIDALKEMLEMPKGKK
jgi:hypothetical protein